MGCPEEKQLFETYSRAVLAHAVADRELKSLTGFQQTEFARIVQEKRALIDKTRKAWTDHIAEHACRAKPKT